MSICCYYYSKMFQFFLKMERLQEPNSSTSGSDANIAIGDLVVMNGETKKCCNISCEKENTQLNANNDLMSNFKKASTLLAVADGHALGHHHVESQVKSSVFSNAENNSSSVNIERMMVAMSKMCDKPEVCDKRAVHNDRECETKENFQISTKVVPKQSGNKTVASSMNLNDKQGSKCNLQSAIVSGASQPQNATDLNLKVDISIIQEKSKCLDNKIADSVKNCGKPDGLCDYRQSACDSVKATTIRQNNNSSKPGEKSTNRKENDNKQTDADKIKKQLVAGNAENHQKDSNAEQFLKSHSSGTGQVKGREDKIKASTSQVEQKVLGIPVTAASDKGTKKAIALDVEIAIGVPASEKLPKSLSTVGEQRKSSINEKPSLVQCEVISQAKTPSALKIVDIKSVLMNGETKTKVNEKKQPEKADNMSECKASAVSESLRKTGKTDQNPRLASEPKTEARKEALNTNEKARPRSVLATNDKIKQSVNIVDTGHGKAMINVNVSAATVSSISNAQYNTNAIVTSNLKAQPSNSAKLVSSNMNSSNSTKAVITTSASVISVVSANSSLLTINGGVKTSHNAVKQEQFPKPNNVHVSNSNVPVRPAPVANGKLPNVSAKLNVADANVNSKLSISSATGKADSVNMVAAAKAFVNGLATSQELAKSSLVLQTPPINGVKAGSVPIIVGAQQDRKLSQSQKAPSMPAPPVKQDGVVINGLAISTSQSLTSSGALSKDNKSLKKSDNPLNSMLERQNILKTSSVMNDTQQRLSPEGTGNIRRQLPSESSSAPVTPRAKGTVSGSDMVSRSMSQERERAGRFPPEGCDKEKPDLKISPNSEQVTIWLL